MTTEPKGLRSISEMLDGMNLKLTASSVRDAADEIERLRNVGVGADVGKPPATQTAMMCEDMPGIPRRIRIDLHTPVERTIHDAMHAVERAGADARLTKAITLLAEAKNQVSDFVEAQPGFACTPLQAGNKQLEDANTARLSGFPDPVRYAIRKHASDIVELWAPGNRRLEQEIVSAMIRQREASR